nr:patatin-like phospholipase family protein [Sphingobium boeckii]
MTKAQPDAALPASPNSGKELHRAFVAFSGGGAKGIVHVGALKALEARAIDIKGVSGTSAGSIVAALVAAGFSAKEMIDTESGQSIFARLTEINPALTRAVDIFGPGGWRRVRTVRWLLTRTIPLGPSILGIWGILTLSIIAAAVFVPSIWRWTSLFGWVLLGLIGLLCYRGAARGLANISAFRDALATLLQQKVFPGEPDRTVKMGDFGLEGRPALKIVSANLSTRRLHLFSADRTPDTPVADAVAASVCLPMIFAPWRVGDDIHVDGGIVSNLPAWPFDEERELDPEALTVTVEIDAGEERPTDHRDWLSAAVATTLWGSGELNLRVSGPSERLALPTTLNLLDFDVTGEIACQAVNDVALAVTLRLDKRLLRLPALYRDACGVVQSIAQDELKLDGKRERVRVAVARLDRGYTRSLRFSHGAGFANDADETMLLPLEGSVAGLAWRERESRFETYPLSGETDLPGPANRLRRKARWRNLAWVMCVPILNKDGAPFVLVQIDSNAKLVDDQQVQAALINIEGAVKSFFGLIQNELVELEDGVSAEK